MICKVFNFLLITVGVLVSVAALALYYVYSPVVTGTLYLEHAMGTAEVLRETDTSIPHVFASSEKMAMYTQGFLHAQERLWQMERMRRMTQGTLSEIMGNMTLGIDKFFRTVGLHRLAIEALGNMDSESLGILEAYADGVNDYVNNLGFRKSQSTGYLMPPEFIVLGVKEFRPWTPTDSLCILKLLNFHLSWNWGQDLLREVIS